MKWFKGAEGVSSKEKEPRRRATFRMVAAGLMCSALFSAGCSTPEPTPSVIESEKSTAVEMIENRTERVFDTLRYQIGESIDALGLEDADKLYVERRFDGLLRILERKELMLTSDELEGQFLEVITLEDGAFFLDAKVLYDGPYVEVNFGDEEEATGGSGRSGKPIEHINYGEAVKYMDEGEASEFNFTFDEIDASQGDDVETDKERRDAYPDIAFDMVQLGLVNTQVDGGDPKWDPALLVSNINGGETNVISLIDAIQSRSSFVYEKRPQLTIASFNKGLEEPENVTIFPGIYIPSGVPEGIQALGNQIAGLTRHFISTGAPISGIEYRQKEDGEKKAYLIVKAPEGMDGPTIYIDLNKLESASEL